jgi:pimeloyl-ACP methyl ester carboxylesterase
MGDMEHFSSFDGTRIAYQVAGEERGASAVLLHHGFASTSFINWVRPGLLDAVVAAGRRAVIVDARGHGASDHPHDPAAYADRAMVRDVSALIDHLELEVVDLAGYSMGGFVAVEAAVAEPRLRSVFLGGVGAGMARGRSPELVGHIIEALETDDPVTVADPSARAFRTFADATRQDRLALAAIQRAGAQLRALPVAEVRVPAIVVNGDRDPLAGDPAALAALIPGATSLVVPGDHLSAVVSPEFRDALVRWASR